MIGISLRCGDLFKIVPSLFICLKVHGFVIACGMWIFEQRARLLKERQSRVLKVILPVRALERRDGSLPSGWW